MSVERRAAKRPLRPALGCARVLACALALAAGCGEGEAPRSRALEGPAGGSEPASARRDAPPEPVARRGLWVLCEGSQRVLEHRERLPLLLDDAEALGVTDLFVQVYRGGRAWFDSSRADTTPYQRVWRVGSGGERRDALRVLIERAHARGLRVHAWVNALQLAANPDAPIVEDLGRAAVAVDHRGRSLLDYPAYEVPPPDRRYYRLGTPGVWLDPAAPGVADWLAGTFAELVRRYPELDGLHLDYIRYPDALPFAPGSRFGVGLHFGYGEATRARFREETGLRAPFGDRLGPATRWDDWRRGKLTRLVREVARRAREAHPEELLVSAAVLADRERAYLVDLQDWPGWLDAGAIDVAVPMLYSLDTRLVRYGVQALSGLARDRPIWVGLGSWLFADDPKEAVHQLRFVEREPRLGSALFSWDSIREAPELRAALARFAGGAEERPVESEAPGPEGAADGPS